VLALARSKSELCAGKWKKFCCNSTMSGSEVFFGFEFGLKAKIRRNKMERKTNRETFAKTWTGGRRRWKN